MSPSKLLIALLLPAATSYQTSQRLRGAAKDVKQAATPSALKRGAGARLAVNQLDALKDILATANEDEAPPRGDISDLLAFSQEAELEQFWLEEAERHEAEDNWAASYDARAEELSQEAAYEEDYQEDYQEDYADILVDEAEDRYKDILDYTYADVEETIEDAYTYADEETPPVDEEEGAVWHCESDGCHKVADAEAIEIDDDEHKGDDYADAYDETQESATWRCGDDGCHQVVDDDEHKDGDEVIEEDYYDDDYEEEGASD